MDWLEDDERKEESDAKEFDGDLEETQKLGSLLASHGDV